MTLSPETLVFLRELCNRITLRAGDPTFPHDAVTIITAMHELDEALKHADNSQ